MDDANRRALAHFRQMGGGGEVTLGWSITINFHPDTLVGGLRTIESMAGDDLYRSQFETRTSNGGMSAFPGGERWLWESRIFARAYDNADHGLRPKYGAVDYPRDPLGGSRRFGSCYIRLRSEVLDRTTFCYPDSHLRPKDFGLAGSSKLLRLRNENRLGLDPVLDNYIEAHVHGPLRLSRDVEAVVLDPSYRGTFVEEAANRLGCTVDWHRGFRLSLDRLAECHRFRGPAAVDALKEVQRDGIVTPWVLGAARDHKLDYQTAKWAWHCVARFSE